MKNKLELQIIHIFFDTATFDKVRFLDIFSSLRSLMQVERDVKITLEGQLGVIGGTMGLFTGFSILSGVEIVYYIVKYLLARLKFRINQEDRKSSI